MSRTLATERQIQMMARGASRNLGRVILTWMALVAIAAGVFCLGGLVDFLWYKLNW